MSEGYYAGGYTKGFAGGSDVELSQRRRGAHELDLLIQRSDELAPLTKGARGTQSHSSSSDSGGVLRWLHVFFLGMATLVPWNTIASSADFFNFYLKDIENSQTWYAWVFQTVVLLILILQVTFGAGLSLGVRFVTGFGIFAVGMAGTFLSVYFVSDLGPTVTVGFVVSVVVVGLVGVGDGLTEGTLYGLCGRLGGYHDAAQAGQAFSGILVTGYIILVTYLYGAPVTQTTTLHSTIIYFSVGIGITIVGLVLAVLLYRLPSVNAPKLGYGGISRTAILYQIWPFALSVFLCYTATLSIFPSLLFNIPMPGFVTSHPDPLYLLLFPYFLLEAFNVGDFIAKLFVARILASIRVSPYVVLALSVLRGGFVPLFYLIAVGAVPQVSVVLLMGLTGLLGLSNGSVSVLSMANADKDLEEAEKDTADYVMMLSLSSGITAGLAIAIPLNHVLCTHIKCSQ